MQFLAALSSLYHTMVLAILTLGVINGNNVRADYTTLPAPITSTTFTARSQPTPTSSDDISLLDNCNVYLCIWSVQVR